MHMSTFTKHQLIGRVWGQYHTTAVTTAAVLTNVQRLCRFGCTSLKGNSRKVQRTGRFTAAAVLILVIVFFSLSSSIPDLSAFSVCGDAVHSDLVTVVFHVALPTR